MKTAWTRTLRILEEAERDGRNFLLEPEVYTVLKEAGIAPPRHLVLTADGTVARRDLAGLKSDKVVVKIVSPLVIHKSDVGGVAIVRAEPAAVKDTVTLINKDLFTDSQWRSMQIRLGVNQARGLGETDPVEVDTTSYNNKVVLHPMDMLQSSSIRQVTLIFRGMPDPKKIAALGKTDLILYVV